MSMDPGRMQIRRYEEQINKLLTNLALPANASELTYWLDKDLQLVVKEPLDPSDINAYKATRLLALQMGLTTSPPSLRTYPAFRTQPEGTPAPGNPPAFTFDQFIDLAFWEKNANRLRSVAALRLPGDPWIGIDMENFAAPYAEPSSDNLAANHLTISELRAAMQPFIDALQVTNASVALGPVNGEDLFYVAEALGRERVEFWPEVTYRNADVYRLSAELDWPVAAARYLSLAGYLQSRFPGYVIRPGIYDLERVWADPYLRDLLRSGPNLTGDKSAPYGFRGGPIAPYGFDHTRYDADFIGTPQYRVGTELTSLKGLHSLNNVRHVWPMHPMGRSVPEVFDTGFTLVETPPTTPGSGPTLVVTAMWTALAAIVGTESALGSAIPSKVLHPEGLEFVTPELPNTWGGLRGAHVLPAHASEPFTIDGTFRLPIGLNQSCPLFGAVSSNNVASWQVAYDATHEEIALYVRGLSPANPHRFIMISPETISSGVNLLPRGVDLRVQVGREGNVWLNSSGIGATLPHSERHTLSHVVNAYDSLLIGAGLQVEVNFPPVRLLSSGAQYFPLQGCPGIVLVKTWSTYDRLLTDAELIELRTQGPLHPAYWPYGYGRPR